jgi:outer membrane protein assembly factor BamB
MSTLLRLEIVLFIILAWSSAMFAQTPQIMWWYNTRDAAFGNAALADLDGDGKAEICFSTYRNDSLIHVLNAENGSVLWTYNTLGCNDAAPLILDVDQNGSLEVVVAGSCNPTTFCLNGNNGTLKWSIGTHGSDSPPSAADIDNDGKPEIIHGEFGGWVIGINAENGSKAWQIPVDLNSWIQTEPAIMDADNNGQLDFVVANWSFGTTHQIFCYRGDNQASIWTNSLPTDHMYHGASFADIDKDGFMELCIGSYDGYLYCLNAEDGSKKWDFAFPSPFYAGSPSSIGDMDNDGWADIIFFDAWTLGCLSHNGTLKWKFDIPSYGQSFRGAALVDMNADDTLDVVFGTSTGHLYVLRGSNGSLMHDVDLKAHFGSTMEFDIDHAPVVADFDGDGDLDVFLVGGHAEYPNIQNNYGRAYAVSFPGASCMAHAKPWPMFRHDIRRSGSVYHFSTGISETDVSGRPLQAFPNPCQGQLHIRSEMHREVISLVSSDVLGRTISVKWLLEEDGLIAVEGLPAGLNVLRIQYSDGHTQSCRVLVEISK